MRNTWGLPQAIRLVNVVSLASPFERHGAGPETTSGGTRANFLCVSVYHTASRWKPLDSQAASFDCHRWPKPGGVRRVATAWKLDAATRCADNHFPPQGWSQREDECFPSHRRHGGLAAGELWCSLARRFDSVIHRPATAHACDRLVKAVSRIALGCKVCILIYFMI